MKPPITNKAMMYELLTRGSLGNTLPCWFSIEDWKQEAESALSWGVRTMTTGGPCRLFCPHTEVEETFDQYRRRGHRPQISYMIDNHGRVTLMADIWESPTGLMVYGIVDPAKGANWRRDMPTLGRTYEGLRAKTVLESRLNENSMDDIRELLDEYPDHVVEISVMDRCFGTVPHRNTILWEVRSY